jgi:protein-tyrosine-phosphatase
MPSILFVCIHNACRSRIAEAVCKSLTPGDWVIASAGSNPSAGVDPKAAEVLKRHQLVMPSAPPKGFADLPAVPWDYVVGMGCGDSCPYVPARKFIEWDIPDPHDGPMSLYEALFNDLDKRIRGLIQEIQGTPP